MKFNIRLISTLAAVAISAIGIVALISIFIVGDDSADKYSISGVGFSLSYTYAIFIIAALVAVLSAVRGMVINPKVLKNAAIGIGTLALIVVISYALGDGSDYEKYKDISEGAAKWVSAGLTAFYITFILTLVTVLYSAVARLIK